MPFNIFGLGKEGGANCGVVDFVSAVAGDKNLLAIFYHYHYNIKISYKSDAEHNIYRAWYFIQSCVSTTLKIFIVFDLNINLQ